MEERVDLLRHRAEQGLPRHSPKHRCSGKGSYLITAACYHHQPFIGYSQRRMNDFSEWLRETVEENEDRLYTWAVLPNHYHLLAETESILRLLAALGKMHGRSSYIWNGEENRRGRSVWFNAAETRIRSERHFYATLNYIHFNPVKHGYVSLMHDWKWTGFHHFQDLVGIEEADRIWKSYPVKDYGKYWDRD